MSVGEYPARSSFTPGPAQATVWATRTHNETLSVAAMRVNDPDCSALNV